MPALAVVAVGAVAAGASAMAQKSAAKRAAGAAKYAADAQAAAQFEMFEIAREDMKPYREAGQKALAELQNIDPTGGAGRFLEEMEALEFKFDPEDEIYKWRQEQNERAVNRFFASRGGFDSRAALNALQESGMALQESEVNRQYNQRYIDKMNHLTRQYEMARGIGAAEYGKLADIASMGRGAAATSASHAMQTGTNLSQIYGQQGNALQQAELMKGAANAQMWQGIGQSAMAGLGAYYGGGGYGGTGAINWNAMNMYGNNVGNMYSNY